MTHYTSLVFATKAPFNQLTADHRKVGRGTPNRMKPETTEPTTQIASESDTGPSAIGTSDTYTTAEVRVPAEKRRRGSIRLRLASLVVACVLPVWIAAGFLVYHNYQSRRALTEQRMLETARALTMVVDREFANMQASLSALATTPSLDSGDLPAFYRRAQIGSGSSPRRRHHPCRRNRAATRQYISPIWRALAQAQRPGCSSPGLLRQEGRLSPTSSRAL